MNFKAALLAIATVGASVIASAQTNQSAPAPAPLRPHYLCQGQYTGQFNTGTKVVFELNQDKITIRVDGGPVYAGTMSCGSWFDDTAHLKYQVITTNAPGIVSGEGDINLQRDGHAFMTVNQNNGLTFNGTR